MSGFIRYNPGGSEFTSQLIFDVVESEEITLENEVTENPVEKGSDVADHVRKKPTGIRLVADVSNVALAPPVESTYVPTEGRFKPLSAIERTRPGDDARTTLERIHAEGLPVELFLGTDEFGRSYTNMELATVGFQRDPKTGDIVRFSLAFKEIRIVESQVVAAPKTASSRGQPTVDRGTQPKKDAPKSDADKAGSTLQHWNDNGKVGGTVGGWLNPGQ